MAEYQSSYTGAEIDAGIGKANTAAQPADLNGKQDTIDSTHKLSADLVDDTSTTNKFVTASDKTTWNGKSVVTGTNDGTNWSTITIDGTTKNIPAPVADYEIYAKSASEIDQTTLGYIYTNRPYRLKITDGTLVEDYVRMNTSSNTPIYFCVIGGNAITLEIRYEGGTYSPNPHTYPLDNITYISGQNDGTNWTSLTIGDTTKNIPSNSAPQLIATKTVDSNDDPYNPMFNFPSITEIQPGHYYLVTKTNWTEGMISGVVEFIVFDRVQGGGETDQHFATGTVVFWQDGTTPSPVGTVYDTYAECLLEISHNDNVWDLWLTAGMNAFNDGAVIKLYYKPL